MRKVILLITLFAFSIGIANIIAQNNEFQKEWNVGASFGVNLSQASFAKSTRGNPVKTSLWMQYQGGFAVRYISENHLGLIAEINYSQQGWRQQFEAIEDNKIFIRDDLEHEHQLNYINVPIMTHIYWGNKVRFFINLGPQIGFLLNEKEKFNDKLEEELQSGTWVSGITNLTSTETGQYYKKADRKFDYGIVAGMGLELRTGIGSFNVEGRYTFGLGDFFSNSKSDHFQRSAHRVIGVKMTYYTKLF